MGQYFLDELEKDISKSNFGKSAYNLGVGTFLNHARNYLNIHVYNAEHQAQFIVNNSNIIRWGVKLQHENVNDRLGEWRMIDSAGYSIPKPSGYFYPGAQTQEITFPEFFKTSAQISSNRYTGFIQNSSEFGDSTKMTFTAGARINYWDLNRQLLVIPRMTFSIRPNWKKDLVFRASAGLYAQPPFYRELRDLYGNINTDVKAQQSLHFLLGSDYQFKAWGRPFKCVTEAYYKYLWDLVPYKIDNVRIRYYADNISKGYAAGIDIRVNGEFVKGIESWASLSLMQTQEDISNDFYYDYYDANGKKVFPMTTPRSGIADSIRRTPGFVPRPTDQRVVFGLFFQDFLPRFPTYKMHLNMLFGAPLPFGPPGTDRYKDTLRMPPYRRVDIGFSKQIIGENVKRPPNIRFFKYLNSVWISVEVFNLLQVNNTISYLWISDVRNRKYAVPSYLTARQLNVRLHVKF
jgi:hypothetical protein